MPTIPENIKNRYLMTSIGRTSGLSTGSIPVARYDGTMDQDVVYLGRPGNAGIPNGSTISGISGMTCWVKGDALALNDGDLVTTWADQSGNSNDFSSSGGNRPSYSAVGMNGVPAVSFNGSTYFPTGPTAASLLSTTAQTTFIVFKVNSGGGGGFSSGNAYSGIGLIFEPSFASYGITLTSGPTIWATAYDGSHAAVQQSISYASVYRMTYYHNGSSIFANLNGGSFVSTASGTSSFAGNLYMGNGQGGLFNGLIAEYITFNRQLTGPEIATVDAYLSLKYSQAFNAPALAIPGGYGFDSSGNVISNSLSVSSTITAGSGLTVTDGGITVTAGNITANSSAISCSSLTSTGAVGGSTFTGSGSGLSNLNASNLSSGTTPLARLSGITTTQLSGSAGLLGSQIASATVTGSNIASATVTGSNIDSATVTGSNIASATVTGSNIASATITGSNIASTTIDSGKLTNVVSSGTYGSVTVDTAGRVVSGTTLPSGAVAATVVLPLNSDFTTTGTISALSLSIGASESWYFKYVIFATVNGGTGNNIQISFSQAVAGWRFNASVLDTNGTATYAIDVASHACTVTVGHVATVIFEGYIANSSTAGILSVSQNNTSCTIAAQSNLFACKQ